MKSTRTALLALALLPAAVAAGPFDQAYVIIETDTAPSTDPNLKPVIINRVDGENSLNNRVVTTPGRKEVVVGLPPRKGFSIGTQETFTLEAGPCMRYYLAAKLDNAVGQRWQAVVRRSEQVGECATKFLKDKPAK